jgi:hypothetical protein
VSTALGPNANVPGGRTTVGGADLYLKYRPITYGSYTVVSLESEWMLRRRDSQIGVLQDQGLYATLFYQFARRFAVAARYEAVTGVAGDELDPAWIATRQRWSGSATFWPTEFSRLRLQYSFDRPGFAPAYHAVVLALEFAVGPHGAHKF